MISGETYRFRIKVDKAAKTLSAWVTTVSYTHLGNISLYNIESTVEGNALITFENVNGPVDSLIIRNCRADGMLIQAGRGDYEYGTGVGSGTSWMEIDTLLLDTVTAGSIQDSAFSFIGRKENEKGQYHVEIGRYLYASKNGDAAAYKELTQSGKGLTVTVKEAAEL